MSTSRIVVLRARARIGMLAAVAAVVAITVLALCAILGSVSASASQEVRRALGARDASTRLVLTAYDPADDATDAGVRALIGGTVTAVEVRREADGSDTHWIITPTPAASVSRLAAQLDRLVDAVDASPFEGVPLTASGELPATVRALEHAEAGLASVLPVAVLLVAGFGALSGWQLAELLALARARETALLRARGLSRAGVGLVSGLEGLAASVLGAVAGFAVALLLDGGRWAAWPAAACGVLGGTVVVGVAAWLHAGRRSRPRSSGARRLLLAAGLTTAAAAVSVLQLRRSGSTLIVSAAGVQPDAVAVLAPVLSLAAVGTISIAALGPLAAVVATRARRTPRPALAIRQVARGADVLRAAALLIAIAVGGTVLAAGYSAGWSALAQASAEQANGADVRARLADDVDAAAAAASVADVPGVTSAAPVATAPVRVGGDPASLIAIAPQDVPRVMLSPGGRVDLRSIESALEGSGVPAVVSRPLADRFGLHVGDELDVQWEGVSRNVTATVAEIVPSVPGSSLALAVLVPLDSVNDALTAAGSGPTPVDEVWADADPDAADAVRGALGDDAVLSVARPGAATAIVAPAASALWAAVATAIALAVAAVAAVAITLLTTRRGETAVLRALGMTSRQQQRSRVAELAGVLAGAAVLGAAGGLLAAALVLGPLVRGAVPERPDGLEPIAAFDPLGLSIAVLALAAAAAAITVWYGSVVRRQALTTTPEALA